MVETGKSATKAGIILAEFSLRGEEVVRVRTGRVISPNCPYCTITIQTNPRVTSSFHRIKFCLKHGYLPTEVDHRDRNPANNSHENLRAANRSLQLHNTGKRRELPRCVYRKKGRATYLAQTRFKGRSIHIGYYGTITEASAAAESKLKELYGDDYSPP